MLFSYSIPYGFDFILAIDWLVDSFRTMLNVTGDSVVAAMVTHYADLEGIEDPLETDIVQAAKGEKTLRNDEIKAAAAEAGVGGGSNEGSEEEGA